MKNEPQPESAEALTREQRFHSEREASRGDARSPELEAEEHDGEPVVGDGIETIRRAAVADPKIQDLNLAQAIRRRFAPLGGIELRLSRRR